MVVSSFFESVNDQWFGEAIRYETITRTFDLLTGMHPEAWA